jgi:hypothetical protein
MPVEVHMHSDVVKEYETFSDFIGDTQFGDPVVVTDEKIPTISSRTLSNIEFQGCIFDGFITKSVLRFVKFRDCTFDYFTIKASVTTDMKMENCHGHYLQLHDTIVDQMCMKDCDLETFHIWKCVGYCPRFDNCEFDDMNPAGDSDNVLINPEIIDTPTWNPKTCDAQGLRYLLHMKSPVILYKVTNSSYQGLFWPDKAYLPGTTHEVDEWNDNPEYDCGNGLNVCTMKMAYELYRSHMDSRILEVVVEPEDIVCIPHAGTGKIRVKKFRVVRELLAEKE